MKKKIGILIGGRSPEYEVSLRAAGNLVRQVRANGYDPVLIGIDSNGQWFLQSPSELESGREDLASHIEVSFAPGRGSILHSGRCEELDVVFPALHGPNGEDGCVQGLLRMAGIPFVGEDISASALCMDKGLSNRLLTGAGLPVPPAKVFDVQAIPSEPDSIIAELGLPIFIKPCIGGSSIGVCHVTERGMFRDAVREASRYDRKIIFEKSILPCREISCGILGSPTRVSVFGEIIVKGSFYSYRQKCNPASSLPGIQTMQKSAGEGIKNFLLKRIAKPLKLFSYPEIPATLPKHLVQRAQELAVAGFEALGCDTMARVDLFLDDQERFFINEINTMPAFNTLSLFPTLWEASGLTQPQLVGHLIEQARARFQEQKSLCRRAPDL